MAEISDFFPKIINEINYDSIRNKNNLFTMESRDSQVVCESIISRDRFENFQSFGHTYSYPQSPLINLFIAFTGCIKVNWSKLNGPEG